MNERTQTYDRFAKMLNYPTDKRFAMWDLGYEQNKHEGTHLTSHISHHLETFKKIIEQFSMEELEELYTRTFDINPIATLEIGWHLFGETYERGAFLVKMRELLRQYAIEESSELPDHITHCLMAVGRMPKNEAAEFVSKYLHPSLDKILEGFQGKENPYEHLLLALKNFIEQEHLQGVATNV